MLICRELSHKAIPLFEIRIGPAEPEQRQFLWAVNMPPLSTTLAKLLAKFAAGVVFLVLVAKFATSILRGLGEPIHEEKKQKSKTL
jgi:hypothetical protein